MDVYKKGEPNRKNSMAIKNACHRRPTYHPRAKGDGMCLKKIKRSHHQVHNNFFLILHDWDQLEFKQALAIAREGSKLYQFKEDALLRKKNGQSRRFKGVIEWKAS